MTQEDIDYLIHRANKEGAKGNRVVSIIYPNSATLNITDTIFVLDHPEMTDATESPWYD